MKTLLSKTGVAVVDYVILAFSLFLALGIRHRGFSIDEFVSHFKYFWILFLIFVFVYALFGLYEKHDIHFRKTFVQQFLLAQAVNLFFSVAFFFIFPEITPKLILAIFFVISSILIFLWRKIVPKIVYTGSVKAIMLGTSLELTELAEELDRDPMYKIDIKAIIHPELLDTPRIKQTINRLISSEKIDAIIVDTDDKSVEDLLNFLYRLSFIEGKVFLIDAKKLYEEVFERIPIELISDFWIIRHITSKETLAYKIFRKTIDTIAALSMGFLFLLVLPVVWFLIRSDGGPLFYISKRMGKGGKDIYLIKFRTMTGQDRGKSALNSKLQVTGVGKVLRKTRIDELPQFFNILRGDISFIGPRPEMTELAKEYSSLLPFYMLRHSVKPGITGWAQVKHRNHPHHSIDVDKTKEKLGYDIFYIKNKGILLDLRTMLLTALAIFKDVKNKLNIMEK